MEPASEQKFRELVLYVCLRSEGDQCFGVTKLNKLLYFIDSESFRQRGKTVSGQQYIKQPYGPVPEHINNALQTLQDAQDMAIRPRIMGIYPQRQPLALRGPDMAHFSSEELCIIDAVVRQYRHMTASQCSTHAHQTAGWRLAEMGEQIPIGSELASDRDLTADELAYARQLAELPGVNEFIAAGAR